MDEEVVYENRGAVGRDSSAGVAAIPPNGGGADVATFNALPTLPPPAPTTPVGGGPLHVVVHTETSSLPLDTGSAQPRPSSHGKAVFRKIQQPPLVARTFLSPNNSRPPGRPPPTVSVPLLDEENPAATIPAARKEDPSRHSFYVVLSG